MKRWLSFCAALVLLLCATAPALGDSNHVRLTVTTTQRIASRSGPGTQYTGTGSYHKAGTQVVALTKAWDKRNGLWWVQIELTYAGKQRRVYTGEQRLAVDLGKIPEEQEVGAGWVTTAATAYYGPGTQYAGMKDPVPYGQSCSVYNYENGYVQVHYQRADGTWHRAWIRQSDFMWTWGPVGGSSGGGSGGSGGGSGGSSVVANPFYMAGETTYVKVYPENYIYPYTDTSLTVLGYENQPNGAVYIAPSDDVYILATGYDWARVSIPVGGGRRIAYVALSDLTPNNATHEVRTGTGHIYCALRRNEALSSTMYAGVGDVMVVVASAGSRFQIIYPVSGGVYRMAWCEISDFYNRSK